MQLTQFNNPALTQENMTTLRFRNLIGPSPSRLALFFIPVVFACVTLPHSAQAVVPAPDGGYPGGNTAEGQNALFSLSSGGYNTALGFFALRSNTTNSFNTAVGAGALVTNTANNNTATGAGALLSNTVGQWNTANGAFALLSNTMGISNTANGFSALESNITGAGNTATGSSALLRNTGDFNTADGFSALQNNTTGQLNIALGLDAGSAVTTASNVICIGAPGANVSNSCYIGGIAGQTVGVGGSTCYVDNDGKLGVFLSARRFKTDIADMDNTSAGLLALRPVTFHYKPELDKTGIPQFGLIAEEVAKVNPDLVTHDAKGELSTVRYEAVNAMLLNEFLKARRQIDAQQKQIDALTAGLQKVSAQLGANKPAPRVVNNL
jgi:hypothetical protein